MDITSGCSPSEYLPCKHYLSVKLKVLLRMICAGVTWPLSLPPG
uniref:Uncharacterized protein n=1 Tax=Zea mays TaxID=4577 RepID=B6SX22_MAIZE|nr:hypothetical protein [Zea mays]